MGVLSFTTFCWEQARAFTLSVFLPGAHVHVVLPGTRRVYLVCALLPGQASNLTLLRDVCYVRHHDVSGNDRYILLFYKKFQFCHLLPFAKVGQTVICVLGCVYHLSQVRNTFQYPLSKRVKTKERRF